MVRRVVSRISSRQERSHVESFGRIVFICSWDHCKSQEKLETMLTQNLGGPSKSIMVLLNWPIAFEHGGFFFFYTNDHLAAKGLFASLKN